MIASPEKLKKAMLSDSAGHAYLITGGDSESMNKLASECAALLLFGNENIGKLENSPDYFNLDGSVKIDDFRAVRRELFKKTFSGKSRAVCIKNAHLLNANTVNAMLKTLEEPPDCTYFFLTGLEYGILPTIRSRCLIMRLGSGSREETEKALLSLGASVGDARKYAAISGSAPVTAAKLYNDENFRMLRERALDAFFEMLTGTLPFDWAKSLTRDREGAKASAAFMLYVCHDLMLVKSRLSVDINIDKKAVIQALASRFTFKQISCIIDRLTAANMRLDTNASVSQLLDGLIAEISEVQ